MKYFILEGENSTGKSTLLSNLNCKIHNVKTIYAIPKEYELLRNKTYKEWSDLSSLFYYLSGNIEQLQQIKEDVVILDRSIISSFSIYLSRMPKKKWDYILPLYKNIIKLLPEITKIYLLIANKDIRLKRMNNKKGLDKQKDLNEIKYEEIKGEARIYLLNNSEFNYEIIDTSYLTKEEVFQKVYQSINNEI